MNYCVHACIGKKSNDITRKMQFITMVKSHFQNNDPPPEDLSSLQKPIKAAEHGMRRTSKRQLMGTIDWLLGIATIVSGDSSLEIRAPARVKIMYLNI
ncbi:hypothetical protein CDL12_08918 [Handroanthus impetiginosus]|uniref:Uncharacterized protein n=1 Tax=Handroanthus impetiginosus TaxID=429701 RepID=A0A2G9HLK7_9LAMI|nr:hypothetical protein CDL12_08918 [Handroanthus impetiginosus]